MDPVVIGAVSALAGVLLGQLLARSGEYRKWLRAERHQASTGLLAAAEAMRRHSAERVLAAYGGRSYRSDQEHAGQDLAGIHLSDLERLTMTLEAVRTVFPKHVVARADELEDAARAIGQLVHDAPAAGAQPGEQYLKSRRRFTEAARRLIAPSLGDRLRILSREKWRLNRGQTVGERPRPASDEQRDARLS